MPVDRRMVGSRAKQTGVKRHTVRMGKMVKVRYIFPMTVRFTVSEAQANLPELLRRAEAGETVIITREGQPDVRLTGSTPAKKRTLGLWSHLGPLTGLDALHTPLSRDEWDALKGGPDDPLAGFADPDGTRGSE